MLNLVSNVPNIPEILNQVAVTERYLSINYRVS